MQYQETSDFAKSLDDEDQLKKFRGEFLIPQVSGKKQIYFLGNSLGLQPRKTQGYIQQILDQWANYGVEGFFKGDTPWFNYHDLLIFPLSQIVGALPHELVLMNQLTVNLHLMMVSFYTPKGKRNKIICEAKAFPSDQYMFETHVKHYGFNPETIIIEIFPRDGEHTIRTEDIIQKIDEHKEELALVLWGGVNYYSGQLFDIAVITKAAHDAGAKVGFDLAHAAGNVKLLLHDWDVDFACWCSYKYLNSGPGAIGGTFIHERFHKNANLPRYAGWWGYDKQTRFKMEKGFIPVESAEGWQISTPAMVLSASHQAALEVFSEAGMENLLQKSRVMQDYLFYILDKLNKDDKGKILEIITPHNQSERGCQVSILMHEKGKRIFGELSAKGVFADWREPNVIRIAPVPLYNTFSEIWSFGNILKNAIAMD